MSAAPSRLAIGLHRQMARQAAKARSVGWSPEVEARYWQRRGQLLFRWPYVEDSPDCERAFLILHVPAGDLPRAEVCLAFPPPHPLGIQISAHAMRRFFDKHPARAGIRGLTDEFRPMVRELFTSFSERMPTLTGEARIVWPGGEEPLVVATWIGAQS